MKIMIEVKGGMIACVSATEKCEVYIVDHDVLTECGDDGEDMKVPYYPDFVSHEFGDDTPLFDDQIDEAIMNS